MKTISPEACQHTPGLPIVYDGLVGVVHSFDENDVDIIINLWFAKANLFISVTLHAYMKNVRVIDDVPWFQYYGAAPEDPEDPGYVERDGLLELKYGLHRRAD